MSQGFATGSLDKDAFAPRLFVERGLEILVCQSYSKNLGLYGERTGAIVLVCHAKEVAERVLSSWKRIARAIYSNPPTHGARIAAEIVNDKDLFAQWKAEMEQMSGRINRMRGELKAALESRLPSKNWSFITSQIGMFSYTGLSPAQVDHMTNKWFVFMTKDGRISMAGLNSKSVDRLADAIVDSITNF